MLSTPHVAVGAAIGVGLSNPVIAIPLTIISHFALDMVPHWNPHLNTDLKKLGKVSRQNKLIVVADSLVALFLGLTIAYSFSPDHKKSLVILLACFVAILPDFVEAPHYFLGHRSELIKRYIQWQKSIQNDVSIAPGLIIQAIVILIALWTIV